MEFDDYVEFVSRMQLLLYRGLEVVRGGKSGDLMMPKSTRRMVMTKRRRMGVWICWLGFCTTFSGRFRERLEGLCDLFFTLASPIDLLVYSPKG